MADILKHPLLMKCYVLQGDIEMLPASDAQTTACIKASELMEAIEMAIAVSTKDTNNG